MPLDGIVGDDNILNNVQTSSVKTIVIFFCLFDPHVLAHKKAHVHQEACSCQGPIREHLPSSVSKGSGPWKGSSQGSARTRARTSKARGHVMREARGGSLHVYALEWTQRDSDE